MSAATVLRAAEEAGVQLWLDGGAVRLRAKAAPPPALLADLRRHRDDVALLLSTRAALATNDGGVRGPGKSPSAGSAPTETIAAPTVPSGSREAAGTAENPAVSLQCAPAREAPPQPSDPPPGHHDAAEADALAEHYRRPPPPIPDAPDPLRDGLLRGARQLPPS